MHQQYRQLVPAGSRLGLLIVILMGFLLSSPVVESARPFPLQNYTKLQINNPFPSGSKLFGYATAVSGDGSTIAVGRLKDRALFGRVLIYIKSQGKWKLQASLRGSQGTRNAQQGSSIAITYNGNLVTFGAPGDRSKWGRTGAAYVFSRNAKGVWKQAAPKLTLGFYSRRTYYNDFHFGAQVAVARDGSLVAISSETPRALVSIYGIKGKKWIRQGPPLTFSDFPMVPNPDPIYASDIAISLGPTKVFVSFNVVWDDVGVPTPPGILVYQQRWNTSSSQTEWYVAYTFIDDLPMRRYGGKIAVSQDGNQIIWGGFVCCDMLHAFLVFDGTRYVLTEEFPVPVGISSFTNFGAYKSATHSNFTRLIIGDVGYNHTGGITFYERQNGKWVLVYGQYTPPGQPQHTPIDPWESPPPHAFGSALACDEEGKVIAFGNSLMEKNAGAVLVYENP